MTTGEMWLLVSNAIWIVVALLLAWHARRLDRKLHQLDRKLHQQDTVIELLYRTALWPPQ